MSKPKKRPDFYQPPPPELIDCAPEQALCYDFIEQAIAAGWRVLPEYPNSRFDMLLVAEEGCSTAGVLAGTQVGVQAKMKLNVEVLGQLFNATRHTHYPGPDYVVALVPGKSRTDSEHTLEEALRKLGYGFFYMYDHFDGHEHPQWNRKHSNLDHMLGFGKHTEFKKRLKMPEVHFWTEPGIASPSSVSTWKIRAIKFCIELDRIGGMTYKDFSTHRMTISTWKNAGWVIAAPEKSGRAQLYILNPDSKERPDRRHPELRKELEKHEEGEKEASRQAPQDGQDVLGD
jgi:hypothetical protein